MARNVLNCPEMERREVESTARGLEERGAGTRPKLDTAMSQLPDRGSCPLRLLALSVLTLHGRFLKEVSLGVLSTKKNPRLGKSRSARVIARQCETLKVKVNCALARLIVDDSFLVRFLLAFPPPTTSCLCVRHDEKHMIQNVDSCWFCSENSTKHCQNPVEGDWIFSTCQGLDKPTLSDLLPQGRGALTSGCVIMANVASVRFVLLWADYLRSDVVSSTCGTE